MPPLLRLPLFAFVCTLLLVGFSVAFTSWWGEAGGTWDARELGWQLVLQGRLHQELEARDRVVVRCVEGKNQAIDEVLAGRLPVAEAVEHFRRLEEARDQALGRTPRETGPEREEELYRGVRTWMVMQKRRAPRGTEAPKGQTGREEETTESAAILHQETVDKGASEWVGGRPAKLAFPSGYGDAISPPRRRRQAAAGAGG